MMSRLKLTLASLLIALLTTLFFYYRYVIFEDTDDCLNQGGNYNYTTKTCALKSSQSD